MLEIHGITLVGLGNGSIDDITLRAWNWLNQLELLWVKNIDHPVIEQLPASIKIKQLAFPEFDDTKIIEQIFNYLPEVQQLTYAVPGSPLHGNPECTEIIRHAGEIGVPVNIIDGIGYHHQLFTDIAIDSNEQIIFYTSQRLKEYYYPPFPPTAHIFLELMSDNKEKNKNILPVLLQQYPAEHMVSIMMAAGTKKQKIEKQPLENLENLACEPGETILYIPPLEEDTSFEAFQDVIAHLRAPDGCPWDRKQTHQSLKTSLLEETYETLTALDEENIQSMAEEFGDLLLQIVLHAQIASEAGTFRMTDILQGIHRKLVRRHPHVFGDRTVSDVAGVLRTWEELKAQERKDNGEADKKGILDGVPKVFPALTQAQEYQKRAGRVGFDWQEIQGVWEKVYEEIEELKTAPDQRQRDAELGDLLFAVVNLARWMNIDAESSLRMTNNRFCTRFKYVEKAVKDNGLKFEDLTIQELDVFWDEAKVIEKMKSTGSGH